MDRFGCHLKIVTGRGNADRQAIEVKKNVSAPDRFHAQLAITDYAREIGLGPLIDDDSDVRVTYDITLGNGAWG